MADSDKERGYDIRMDEDGLVLNLGDELIDALALIHISEPTRLL